jgi:hypothetical protein
MQDEEDELFEWFLKTRRRGDSVLNPDIQNKAREVCARPKFKASVGWLLGFKKRYNIGYKGKSNDAHGRGSVRDANADELELEYVAQTACTESFESLPSHGHISPIEGSLTVRAVIGFCSYMLPDMCSPFS